MKKQNLIVAVAFAAITLFGCKNDNGVSPDTEVMEKLEQDMNLVQQATASYLDVNQAIADGYVNINVFVSGQGHHFLNASLLDGTFDKGKPEILVYAAIPDTNHLQLVGVEYAVPVDLSPSAPDGFDGDFDLWNKNEAFGLWTLHAWFWLRNPDGVFAELNPLVP